MTTVYTIHGRQWEIVEELPFAHENLTCAILQSGSDRMVAYKGLLHACAEEVSEKQGELEL